MQNKWTLIGLFIFVFLAKPIDAQRKKEINQALLEDQIMAIAESLEEDSDVDFTTLFDALSEYYTNPIDLNTASEDELHQLYILNDFQVLSLLDHIEKHGSLESIFELQAINGFDVELIRMLLPFVKVSAQAEYQKFSFSELWNKGNSDLFIRYQQVVEQQQGYVLDENGEKDYLGNPGRFYTRYRYKYKKNLSFGITAEKDPGEEFFSGSQKGFDFYSAHLSYKGKGFLRGLSIGDYHVQFGQGLALWSGLSFGKSAYVMNVKKRGMGLRPYTSVDENLFMRGAAAVLGVGALELTTFYSSKYIDANLISDDSLALDEPIISSFQQSGFHRNEGELIDKDAIKETHYGANLSYKKRRFQVGLSAIKTNYQADLQRSLQLYNQFVFNSNEGLNFGLDYNWIKNNFNFFGETAMSENGAISTLNGVLLALDPRLSVSILHRHYDKSYQGLQTAAFAESSQPANEQGIYMGTTLKLTEKHTLSAYYDQFRFPWMKFRTDAPSIGHDYLIQLNYRMNRKNEFYVRYRSRTKAINSSDEEVLIDYPIKENKHYFRLNASYQINEAVKFKSRLEWMNYDEEGKKDEHGFLFSHDVIVKRIDWPISLTLRYALFVTDSYDSRIYSYENDLLYTWSIPAYSSRGYRYYIMLKWRLWRKTDLWLRWSQWNYSNRNTISSGSSEILGNKKSEIKAQLRIRF